MAIGRERLYLTISDPLQRTIAVIRHRTAGPPPFCALLDEVERAFCHDAMDNTTTDTKQKILVKAEALIYQNGIHATGMDLLVKTSGVARKSIYRHFEKGRCSCCGAERPRRALAGLVPAGM